MPNYVVLIKNGTVSVHDESGLELEGHKLVVGAVIYKAEATTIRKGDKIPAGTTLAKTPRKVSKAKDITGGLPRVAELFEARKPKDHCEIAKIDGVVAIGGMVRGKRKVIGACNICSVNQFSRASGFFCNYPNVA